MSKSKSSKKSRTPRSTKKRESDCHPADFLRRLLSGTEPALEADRPEWGFWRLPASGGYHGGITAGTAAATAYLKFLRLHPNAYRQCGGFLQCIAMDMLSGRSTGLGSINSESLRGQAVGFFGMIDSVLCECAHLLTGLDAESFVALQQKINLTLGRTEAENNAEAWAYSSQILDGGQKQPRDKAARNSGLGLVVDNTKESAHGR